MKGNLFGEAVAEPYAEAMMSVAQSQNLTDKFGEDARALIELVKSSPELQKFLGDPLVPTEKRKEVIRQVVGDQVHSLMMNFLMLLVDKKRILFLETICQEYLNRLRELNQTVLAEVTSAVELSEEQKQSVREKVKSVSGAREVELATKVDRDLIGGVIIKVGSQVFDASLRGQLRRISLRLSNA
ncbi:F0F1 ATP synthase subunit delta [[Phormidium ambiguum] IAM M-71]|uniref:ATP synthase subunit delta n=1 Tax=[Phormidium ambiguum] IAM M-71 TaxID=454136 RepID=A0A1U7IJY2_9CYAN|nr:ATP synthase F1 subunit delta [Phormidium ambiguum]OKH37516.1 F0F1 ATP synthase subunit delta [Phormidium ambiguum IAM M-71]